MGVLMAENRPKVGQAREKWYVPLLAAVMETLGNGSVKKTSRRLSKRVLPEAAAEPQAGGRSPRAETRGDMGMVI